MIIKEEERGKEVEIEKIDDISAGRIYFFEETICGQILIFKGEVREYDFSIGEEEKIAYESTTYRVCDECYQQPLYDDNNDEYYCPLCQ